MRLPWKNFFTNAHTQWRRSRHWHANTTEAKGCYQISSKKRWALTGTPIHNNLTDVHSLLKFFSVLNNQKEFRSLTETRSFTVPPVCCSSGGRGTPWWHRLPPSRFPRTATGHTKMCIYGSLQSAKADSLSAILPYLNVCKSHTNFENAAITLISCIKKE